MPKDISYTSVSWCGRELTIGSTTNYGIFVGTPSKNNEKWGEELSQRICCMDNETVHCVRALGPHTTAVSLKPN